MNTRKNSPEQGRRSDYDIGQDPLARMVLPVGRSLWAIAAGYLGLLSLAIIPAPLAVIVSVIAIIDISKSKGTEKPKHGMGRAIFGLVAGGIVSIFLFIAIVAGMIQK